MFTTFSTSLRDLCQDDLTWIDCYTLSSVTVSTVCKTKTNTHTYTSPSGLKLFLAVLVSFRILLPPFLHVAPHALFLLALRASLHQWWETLDLSIVGLSFLSVFQTCDRDSSSGSADALDLRHWSQMTLRNQRLQSGMEEHGVRTSELWLTAIFYREG